MQLQASRLYLRSITARWRAVVMPFLVNAQQSANKTLIGVARWALVVGQFALRNS